MSDVPHPPPVEGRVREGAPPAQCAVPPPPPPPAPPPPGVTALRSDGAGSAPPALHPDAQRVLAMGIASFFCFSVVTGIPAIVIGRRARRDIEASGGALTGDRQITTGILLGWLSVAGIASLAAIMVLTELVMLLVGPQLGIGPSLIGVTT